MPKTADKPAKLTAINLKNALWDTLNDIRAERKQPGEGDAIASQAREILRTVKVQLQVAAQTNRKVPAEVIDFSEQ
jgi:hypothetical protein